MFGFPNIIMYILNIASTIKKMSFNELTGFYYHCFKKIVNELRDFIFQNYYTRMGFDKETKKLLFDETLEKKKTYRGLQVNQ